MKVFAAKAPDSMQSAGRGRRRQFRTDSTSFKGLTRASAKRDQRATSCSGHPLRSCTHPLASASGLFVRPLQTPQRRRRRSSGSTSMASTGRGKGGPTGAAIPHHPISLVDSDEEGLSVDSDEDGLLDVAPERSASFEDELDDAASSAQLSADAPAASSAAPLGSHKAGGVSGAAAPRRASRYGVRSPTTPAPLDSRLARVCWNAAVVAMSLVFMMIGIQQAIFMFREPTAAAGLAGSSSSTGSTHTSISDSSPNEAAMQGNTPSATAVSVAPSPATALASFAVATHAPPPAPDRMIVVAGYSASDKPFDMNWLLYYFSDHCITVIDHGETDDGTKPVMMTPNVAREAPAFLRFIVDHYDNLPARTVFLHGHRTSWHDKDEAVVLRYLRWDLDFANLNWQAKYRIGPNSVGGVGFRYDYIKLAWPKVFQPWFGDMPPYFDMFCCGQFLVSRDNLRAVPLAFWRSYLDFATTTDILSGPDLSIMYEHMWTFLMTRGTWNATISDNPEEELCKVLTVCPLPEQPVMDPAVRTAEGTAPFYPCGAYPAVPPRPSVAASVAPSTVIESPAPTVFLASPQQSGPG